MLLFDFVPTGTFGVAAFVATFLGGFLYCVRIVRNKDPEKKPVRSTWSIWSLGSVLLVLSYYESGARDTVPMAIALGLEYVAVALLSIKYGTGGWDKRTVICLSGAILSGIVWMITHQPRVALIALIALDAFGAYPTLEEVWKKSQSEPKIPWVLTSLGSFLNLLAVNWSHTTFVDLVFIAIYPIYMMAFNGLLTILLFRPRTED